MARDRLLLLVQQAHERRHMQQLGRGPNEGVQDTVLLLMYLCLFSVTLLPYSNIGLQSDFDLSSTAYLGSLVGGLVLSPLPISMLCAAVTGSSLPSPAASQSHRECAPCVSRRL
jgi:hypothetical protein